MSKYADKITNDQCPSDQDWNEHLLESHKLAPSMTPDAFAKHKTEDGISSYEVLADSIKSLQKSSSTVLDLACGDGYLFPFLLDKLGPQGSVIGVDMSAAELAVARNHHGSDPRIKLYQATAQNLPIPNESADAIVCHMAFMLMMPLDPAIAEIKRVLKRGACFAAVFGNARSKGGLLGDILKFTNHFIDARYPIIFEAPMGDARVQSADGLRQLFSAEQGFQQPIDIFDFSLLMKMNPQGVWNLMKDMYHVSMLPLDDKLKLESELKKFSESKADSDGNLSFEFAMRRMSVRKL